MAEAIIALDAGTTSVRAMTLDGAGSVVGRATRSITMSYPAPGHAEQDPEEIIHASLDVLALSLKDAGLAPGDVAAIGITTQRSNCIVWERASGKALGPLVSWQDGRGAERAVELQAEGFFVMPPSAAAKLEALLETIPEGRQRLSKGELAWGNIDTYLAWRLSGGSCHVTDPSQACTTGYYDLFTGEWNPGIVELQGLPLSFFPKICDSAGHLGQTTKEAFGAEIPIGAIIGDQQCAAVAQGCVNPGEGKVTYGTSGTCNVNTGEDIVAAQGTYPLVLLRRNGTNVNCVEGMVITAGAVFDWLAGALNVLDSPSDAAALAQTVSDTHGVYLLPALQGLGSPHSDPERHALIGGLTRGATKAHVVRAAMEGVAFRVREMVDCIYSESGLPRPETQRVDGGASANDVLMQIQANVLGCPIERMDPMEATAYGAAILAGETAGAWTEEQAASLRAVDRTFESEWSQDERDERFERWKKACGLETP